MKRSRRKASEIRALRKSIQKIVKGGGRITLTNLVRQHGESLGIRDTPSDKSLAKRQLDILAKTTPMLFERRGRDLIAEYPPPAPPSPAEEAPAAVAAGGGESPPDEPPPPVGGDLELAAIKLYARHLQAFSQDLQQQVRTLVRMVEDL